MTDVFADLAAALDNLNTAIEKALPPNQELIDIWGWNNPVLNRDEIGERAFDLANRVRNIPEDKKVEPFKGWIDGVAAKVDKFRLQTAPQFTGGNAAVTSALMEQLFTYIEGRLPPENRPIDWEAAAASGEMPRNLARRLRGLEARLTQLEPRAERLDEKILVIESAHSAAETLPTDLESLNEARAQVADIADELKVLAKGAREASEKSTTSLEKMEEQSGEAAKLMGNIDSAYRASTSKALADAFAKRSFWLQVQTWVFVLLLILALSAGGALGFRRVSMLEQLMTRERPVDSTVLWLNVALSFLSVAAPVWFAWVATKQIGQRFRLAEDYGFKAAVAKAYEGYRREAANVDPLFVTRLFGSALARLEEAPLRLVDDENYGSPFHELTASPGFREALGVIPALRDSYKSILEAMSKTARKGAVEAASASVAVAEKAKEDIA